MGRPADKEDSDSQNSSSSSNSSGNGNSRDSSLSQVGAAVLGAEAAERESRPAMAAGMGPSSPTSNTLRASGNLEVTSQGAGQRNSVVRSMILEKPPSFKVGALLTPSCAHHLLSLSLSVSHAPTCPCWSPYSCKLGLQVRSQLPGQAMAGRTGVSNSRPRLRVSSLDETKSGSEISKRPAGSIRPAANVR